MTQSAMADFVLGPVAIPDPVRDVAGTLLLDTIGVAAGASGLQAGRIARDFAHGHMGPGSFAAPLMFDGRLCGLPGAAFAAATQIDNLDAHDGYNPVKGHIGCAVVPALFAFATLRPDLVLREAANALVVAYEVAARAGTVLHATVSDYHTSGAWNALGVAALGARLLGLSPDQLRHALGIAEFHGPRSQMMREIANPTMLHDGSGMGAMVGVQAVLMAQAGFAGAPAITVEQAPAHWADLGTDWTITRNYIKPYPVCRWAHPAIDGLRQLRLAHGFDASDIARIEIETFDAAAALYPDMPDTTSKAQYSLPFAVAMMAVRGQVGPDEVQGAALSDPDVAALLPRIAVTATDRHTARFPDVRTADVAVVLTDGSRRAVTDVQPRGGPQEVPMPPEEVQEKFGIMTATLDPGRRAALWAMRGRMDADAPFSGLADLVTAPI